MAENYWTRKLNRRRFVAGSATFAAGSAALLAGCGDDDAKPAGTSTTAAAGSTTAASPAAGTPKRGGTLKLWKTAKDGGLDPAVFHLQNRDILERVMNFPIAYQVTKNKVSMDGMLSYEQTDPLHLTWKVRPGMTFQNGDPLGAEEWAFSMTRVKALYKQLGTTHTPPPFYSYIDKVEAIDATTVRETWTAPTADAVVHRSRHYFGWVNPKIVASKGVDNQIQDFPAGAGGGPYTLEQHDATATLVKRWPGYYKYAKADDGFVADGGPYIDTQQMRIIPDRAAAKAAFTAGDLDFFGTLDKLEIDEFKGNSKVNVVKVPATGTSLLGMDGGKFFDLRARQAIYKGIDYEGFIKSIRGGDGVYGAPININMPQFSKLTQDQLKKYYKFDPAEAKKLWSAAGSPVNSIKILISTGDPLVNDIYDFVSQSLKSSLGIPVTVEAVDINTWAARATDRKNPTKDWELLGYGNGTAGVLSGEPTDNALVHFDPKGYGINAFNFWDGSDHKEIVDGSKFMTDLMVKQAGEVDPVKRADLLTQIQTWILDNAWCNMTLPTAKSSYLGWSSRLQDYAADDWLNNYGIRRHSMWLNA